MKFFKRDDYKNCKCRPVTKEAKVNQLKKLQEWGYCPVCEKYS